MFHVSTQTAKAYETSENDENKYSFYFEQLHNEMENTITFR